MSHLTSETIARLADEEPGADEARHLAVCSECREELDAMRDDVQALSMLPDMAPAADGWAALERRLAGEGLLNVTQRRPATHAPRMLQIAAAVVLFLGGTLAGRMTAAGPAPGGLAQHAVPGDVPQQTVGEPSLNGAPPAYLAAAEPGLDSARDPRLQPPVQRGNPSVTLAGSGGFSRSAPRTMEEAASLLRQTEELYLTALTRYAELATQTEPGDPIARLAALQSIVMTTQAALDQTPTDPVINGYHLTALAQRDATLRQVAATTDRWH
jgi:hypothetical protein